jgi:hypothetical protein
MNIRVLLFWLVAIPAFAKAPDERRPDVRADMKVRLQERILQLMTTELAAAAHLTDDKTQQLKTALAASMARKEAVRAEKRAVAARLRKAIDAGAADVDIARDVQAIVALKAKEEDLLQLSDALAAVLTPTEHAQIVLAFPGVFKDVRDLLDDKRRLHDND